MKKCKNCIYWEKQYSFGVVLPGGNCTFHTKIWQEEKGITDGSQGVTTGAEYSCGHFKNRTTMKTVKKILINTLNHHGVHFWFDENDPLKTYIKDTYVAFIAIECAMEEYAKEEIMNFLQTVKGSDMMYKTRQELLDIYLKGKQL